MCVCRSLTTPPMRSRRTDARKVIGRADLGDAGGAGTAALRRLRPHRPRGDAGRRSELPAAAAAGFRSGHADQACGCGPSEDLAAAAPSISARLRHRLFTGTPRVTTLLTENFDAAPVGTLPAGWTSVHGGGFEHRALDHEQYVLRNFEQCRVPPERQRQSAPAIRRAGSGCSARTSPFRPTPTT